MRGTGEIHGTFMKRLSHLSTFYPVTVAQTPQFPDLLFQSFQSVSPIPRFALSPFQLSNPRSSVSSSPFLSSLLSFCVSQLLSLSPFPRFAVSIFSSRLFASDLLRFFTSIFFHTLLLLKSKVCPGPATIPAIETFSISDNCYAGQVNPINLAFFK